MPHQPPATTDPSLSGYQIVEDLLKRQDAVLTQIDDLNERIEGVIAAITASREPNLPDQTAASPEDSAPLALPTQSQASTIESWAA